MKTWWRSGVAVASSVINSHWKWQLPTCLEIVNEARHCHWFIAEENKLAAFFTLEHISFLNKILDSESGKILLDLVHTQDWNLKLRFGVRIAKIGVANSNLFRCGAVGALDKIGWVNLAPPTVWGLARNLQGHGTWFPAPDAATATGSHIATVLKLHFKHRLNIGGSYRLSL